MLTVPDSGALADPRAAAPRAIERNARQMIEPAMGEFEGLPALRRFAAEVGRVAGARSRTGSGAARFCYQVIERRGTGGGNFRLMYSRFLAEAGRDEAELAAEAVGGLDVARRGTARRERSRSAAARDVVAGRRPRRGGARGRGAPLAGAAQRLGLVLQQAQHRALDPLPVDELAGLAPATMRRSERRIVSPLS